MSASTTLNALASRAGEIVSGDRSGGTNTSHTIVVEALRALLRSIPPDAPASDYEYAAIVQNALGKQTQGARQRTFRYLRELYLLRPDSLLFRALRDLWSDDEKAQPLLACLCALARDSVFRATSPMIINAVPGDFFRSADLAESVALQFPGAYRESTLAKIGRNTFSSWEQSGHLSPSAPTTKTRVRAGCRPANVAYALLIGHLQGFRGLSLFETIWARVLDRPTSQLFDLAVTASQMGLIEFRHAGGVVDVSFSALLRPFEGELA